LSGLTAAETEAAARLLEKLAAGVMGEGRMRMTDRTPRHFRAEVAERIATVRLDRCGAEEPADLRQLCRTARLVPRSSLCRGRDVVVFASNGGNFSSGGDVHDIIGPLTEMSMKELLAFTRMTGDLVKAMIHCGKPVVAAVDGVCVGAGAIIAMASDLRLATPEAKTAFLFTRVGLAGADMGACAILPRIVGQGRAAELLYTGRSMSAEEGLAWGFFNRLVPAAELEARRGRWPFASRRDRSSPT
jgi:enoyl-CoA hydratase/carnithine racemase